MVSAMGLVLAGCGATSDGGLFSAGDAERLMAVGPRMPGSDWPQDPLSSPTFGRDDSTCDLFESASAAHAALPGLRAFAFTWAKRDGGRLRDARIEDLGQEAWVVGAGPADFGEEITFGWRDRNLLVEAHIQCIFSTCHSDIGRAGRAWANAIDGEAR